MMSVKSTKRVIERWNQRERRGASSVNNLKIIFKEIQKQGYIFMYPR